MPPFHYVPSILIHSFMYDLERVKLGMRIINTETYKTYELVFFTARCARTKKKLSFFTYIIFFTCFYIVIWFNEIEKEQWKKSSQWNVRRKIHFLFYFDEHMSNYHKCRQMFRATCSPYVCVFLLTRTQHLNNKLWKITARKK